jgi:hypothetical protein
MVELIEHCNAIFGTLFVTNELIVLWYWLKGVPFFMTSVPYGTNGRGSEFSCGF